MLKFTKQKIEHTWIKCKKYLLPKKASFVLIVFIDFGSRRKIVWRTWQLYFLFILEIILPHYLLNHMLVMKQRQIKYIYAHQLNKRAPEYSSLIY